MFLSLKIINTNIFSSDTFKIEELIWFKIKITTLR